MLKRWITVLCLSSISLLSVAREPDRDGAARQRPRATLDDFVESIVVTEIPGGGRMTTTMLREKIPYARFMEMWEAQQNDLYPPSPIELHSATSGQCFSIDDDYDGDGFVGVEETSGSTLGDQIADLPLLSADFRYITARMEYVVTSTGQTSETITTDQRLEMEEKQSVSETREFQNNFNSTTNVKLEYGFALKEPLKAFDFGRTIKAEKIRKLTVKRSREQTRTVQDKWSLTRTQSQTNQISHGPNAGQILAVAAVSHAGRKTAVQVNRITLLILANDPYTGAKDPFMFTTVDSPFLIAANGEQEIPIDISGINSGLMLDTLASGALLEFEVLDIEAVIQENQQPLELLDTSVEARTAKIAIHYGGQRDPALEDVEFFQVAVNRPDGSCPTARELLETAKTSANVEFGRLDDGTLVVERIGSVANTGALVDPVTGEVPDDFGRWAVGFEFDVITGTVYETLDLENTPLASGDRIHFYYLTADDLREGERPFDRLTANAVGNDGVLPQQADVEGDFAVGDRIEMEVDSAFIHVVPYTESRGTVYVIGCGQLYGSTFHGINVYDSAQQAINVGGPDFYGMELSVNQGPWLRASDLLNDATLDARMLDEQGFPEYAYTLEFTVSDALTGGFSRVPFDVRNTIPWQDSYLIGFTGYDVRGRSVDCRISQDPGAFFYNTVNMRVWLETAEQDDDEDGSIATAAGGIDFDDQSAFRFPFAPEMLDGIDNNGDALTDNGPMLCPADLEPNRPGTCVLDDRMGWYEDQPAVELQMRTHMEDGSTTPWETIGSVTEYTVIMPADPAVASVEIKASYWPPSGGVFSGSNFIDQTDPGAPAVYQVGEQIEAESGLLIYPMQVVEDGFDRWIEVPVDSPYTTGGRADYPVQIVEPGPYRIWARVSAEGFTDDSFVVEVFDPAEQPVDFGFGGAAHFRFEYAVPDYSYGSFGWTQVGHANVYTDPPQYLNPVTYDLSAGVHTVRFRLRELGARLDALRVERLCLDNDGDGWTDCAGDCNDDNGSIHPGRAESCSTSWDDDCDGFVNEGCNGGSCRKNCRIEEAQP